MTIGPQNLYHLIDDTIFFGNFDNFVKNISENIMLQIPWFFKNNSRTKENKMWKDVPTWTNFNVAKFC
jgi:hypothetical protein